MVQVISGLFYNVYAGAAQEEADVQGLQAQEV